MLRHIQVNSEHQAKNESSFLILRVRDSQEFHLFYVKVQIERFLLCSLQNVYAEKNLTELDAFYSWDNASAWFINSGPTIKVPTNPFSQALCVTSQLERWREGEILRQRTTGRLSGPEVGF